jgi:hypothetical protein
MKDYSQLPRTIGRRGRNISPRQVMVTQNDKILMLV